MPLGFPSVNRGVVAFGFFNIDTDLLLLEHYFLFADAFCRYVSDLTVSVHPEDHESSWEVYDIPDPGEIGDLMAAIHGVRFTGFIGDVYRRFPFPREPEGFKQKPEGFRNRHILEVIIEKYALKTSIPFRVSREKGTVLIGEYLFTGTAFQDLIRYVWVGGYPRWRDETRPDYVTAMKMRIDESRCRPFAGLILD